MLGLKAAMLMALPMLMGADAPPLPLRARDDALRRGFRYRTVNVDGVDCVISDQIPSLAPFEPYREGYEAFLTRERFARQEEKRRFREAQEEEDRLRKEREEERRIRWEAERPERERRERGWRERRRKRNQEARDRRRVASAPKRKERAKKKAAKKSRKKNRGR